VVDGAVDRARLTFVSVTDVPVVLDVTEPFAGAEPSAVDWSGAADLVAAAVTPEGDIHASAEYRRMLAVELSRIALAEAARSAAPGAGRGAA
jgi:carbon-monoxide dehydrogenase medium subunit